MFSVAHFSEHEKFALCLRLISVGYTKGWGGLVTSYLKGVQRIVTKCEDGGGRLIFP